jgi:LysR family transcriptional regulator, hydrogen peroxide-inducible genes activator
MPQLPSLKKLQYLVKLHELQHFGKTAEACFVSQSTLSAGIKDLESGLNRVLIERDRHRMVFTATGIELVKQAKDILSAANLFVATAEKSNQFFSSRLRLGIIPTIAPYILPAYLQHLNKLYPDLTVFVREDLSGALVDLLQKGELDLLILALPYPADFVTSKVLYSDSLHLIHHKDFITITADSKVQDLPDNSVFLLEDGHCLRDHTLESCQLVSKQQINPFSTNSLTTIIQMVQYNLGVSYIPSMAIADGLLKKTNINVCDGILSCGVKRDIGIAWRESSPFSAEFNLLGEHLLELARRTT